MAPQKILAVGLELIHDEVECVDFHEEISLFDWDIVLFRPSSDLFFCLDKYQGLPSLSDDSSFKVKRICERWHREIKAFSDSGKNIFIFLSELQDVFVDSGNRQYSGTGRNRQTTRLVENYSNYKSIPLPSRFIGTNGSNIKIENKHTELLGEYWREMSPFSSYKVIIEGDKVPACFVTRVGNKPVGAIYKNRSSNGSIVLLPDLDFYSEKFFETKEDNKDYWNGEAEKFGAKLIHSIVGINKSLVGEGQFTPEPGWAGKPEYSSNKSEEIRQRITLLNENITKLEEERDAAFSELKDSQKIRGLLYEKGKTLEAAIIEALKILGFSAEPFQDANSEFDVVFESVEGRLIGEAEGKDNKPINIDKLRQLSANIHEDLQREDISAPAKGVLFGNGYRLQPVDERPKTFTDKCITTASTMAIALLPTMELFSAALFLSNNPNAQYATKCRKTLLESVGVISFPPPDGVDIKET